MEKLITYCQQPCKIGCDENCDKAWGRDHRPKIKLSKDPDDYAYLSDAELGTAPVNPGTYECDDAKPTSKEQIPNKWCVRECERLKMSMPGEWDKPLKLTDFGVRVYNQPFKHLDANIPAAIPVTAIPDQTENSSNT